MPDARLGSSLLGRLDDLARGKGPLHALHPAAKLAATAAYLVALLSFGSLDLFRMLPLVLYPVACLSLEALPLKPLAGMLLVASPPVLGLGILHPLLSRGTVALGGLIVPRGWLVLAGLCLRTLLAVSAAYILAATTPADAIFRSLRRFGLPRVFCLVSLLVFRYVALLVDEVSRLLRAHELRSGGRRGVAPRLWGPLLGSLLIRSHGRAERVYGAMRLRGFDGEYRGAADPPLARADILYCLCCAAAFAAVRFVDIPLALGSWATRALG